jgi:hypothetical protein
MNSNSPDCSVEVVDETTMLFSWEAAGKAKKLRLTRAITIKRMEINLIKYFQAVLILNRSVLGTYCLV